MHISVASLTKPWRCISSPSFAFETRNGNFPGAGWTQGGGCGCGGGRLLEYGVGVGVSSWILTQPKHRATSGRITHSKFVSTSWKTQAAKSQAKTHKQKSQTIHQHFTINSKHNQSKKKHHQQQACLSIYISPKYNWHKYYIFAKMTHPPTQKMHCVDWTEVKKFMRSQPPLINCYNTKSESIKYHILLALNMGTCISWLWWWAGWPISFCRPTRDTPLANTNSYKSGRGLEKTKRWTDRECRN